MLKLNDLLNDIQSGHDDTQIESFMIIKNGGTPWGCYKQALRELSSRVKTLQSSWVGLQKLNRKLDNPVDELEKLELDLELAGVYEHVNTVKRETAKIYMIACSLKQVIGDLDTEKIKALNEEFWVHKIKVNCVQDLLDNGKLSSSTRSLIQSLSKPMKKIIHEALIEPQELVDWFIEFESPVPEVADASEEALKEINYVANPNESLKRLSSSVGSLSL